MTDDGMNARAWRRQELILDGAVHAAGLVLSLVGLPVLITLAAVWHGGVEMMTALGIYAATMLGMFACSGAYNLILHPPLRGFLRRLDHAAIYLKIAGTQTPFAVLAGGSATFWLLAGIWVAALTGACAKLLTRTGWDRISVFFYLALGWAGAMLLPALAPHLAPATLVLIVSGGVLYSVGVIFHMWEALPFQNAIWHIFVLAATFTFYSALLVEIVIGHALA